MNSLLNYYSLTNKTHDTYLNYLTGFIKLYKLVSDSLEELFDAKGNETGSKMVKQTITKEAK